MHELLTYLNQRGIATIMVRAQHGVGCGSKSSFDISYLSDAIILIRYFAAGGEVRKSVSVLKSRAAAQMKTAGAFDLSETGFTVGPPHRGLDGVLTHAPRRPSDLLVPILNFGGL